jgi:transposase
MPRAYSVDLRERVMAAVADGASIAEVAQRFSVSVDAIDDWKLRQAATASLAPATPTGGRPRRLAAAQEQALQAHIDAEPDATIAELRTWLAQEHQVVVGWGTVCRTLERLDRPRKKRA